MCDATPAQSEKSSFARQHEAVSSDVAMGFDIGNTPIRIKANIIESLFKRVQVRFWIPAAVYSA